MKSLFWIIAGILGFSTLAQAQLWEGGGFHLRPAATYNQGALFFNNRGNDSDNRDLLNLYASAAGYGFWVNAIRNGSGNGYAYSPLRAEGLASQSLRVLSLFDLYFSYGVHRKELEPSFDKAVTMDFVGLSASKDYIRAQPEMKPTLSRQGLQSVFELVAPIFNDNFRLLPADYRTNASFIKEAHAGVKNNILQHWPMSKTGNGYPQRLIWLAESYLPLMTSGNIDLEPQFPSVSRFNSATNRCEGPTSLDTYYRTNYDGTRSCVTPQTGRPASRAHFETLLPQIGELVPKSGPCPQTIPPGTIQQKKADGTEVCAAPIEEWYIQPIYQDLKAQGKEIRSPPAVIDEISLGRRERNHTTTLPAIKISTDKDFSKPDELILTAEFGHVNTDATSQLTPMVFDDPEEALVARGHLEGHGLDGIKIRLAFHRLALRLKRSSGATASWKYALENDPTFDKIEVVREKSLKTLTLFVPQTMLAKAARWFDIPLALMGQYGTASQVVKGLTALGCQEMPGYCGYSVSNVDGLSKFKAIKTGSGFINKKADDAVDHMIPASLAQSDQVASTAVMAILSKLKSGISLLQTAREYQYIKEKLK